MRSAQIAARQKQQVSRRRSEKQGKFSAEPLCPARQQPGDMISGLRLFNVDADIAPARTRGTGHIGSAIRRELGAAGPTIIERRRRVYEIIAKRGKWKQQQRMSNAAALG